MEEDKSTHMLLITLAALVVITAGIFIIVVFALPNINAGVDAIRVGLAELIEKIFGKS